MNALIVPCGTQAEMRFCSSVLWPVFHGFANRVRCTTGEWQAYVEANEHQAREIGARADADTTLWVRDYSWLLLARALRRLGHRGRIGLFLPTPFPDSELLATIPWGDDVIDAMLAFDLVGFQTPRFARNFMAAVRTPRNRGKQLPLVEAFPETIDPELFRERGTELPEVAGLRSALAGRRLLLAIDRLDYASGIAERLDAYERLLERHPEWWRRVSLLQLSTSADTSDDAELRQRIERMVGRINGRFGETDWVPVRYLYRAYDAQVRAQLYRLADVAVATPLREGMSLVAKEFIAAQDPAEPGVLVLSQHSGAAETLAGALVTNPYHPEGLAADLDQALHMAMPERLHRHRTLLAVLEREGDAKSWAARFLDRLAPRRLQAVP